MNPNPHLSLPPRRRRCEHRCEYRREHRRAPGLKQNPAPSPIYLPIYLPTYLPTYLYLSIYLSIYLYLYLHIHKVNPNLHLSPPPREHWRERQRAPRLKKRQVPSQIDWPRRAQTAPPASPPLPPPPPVSHHRPRPKRPAGIPLSRPTGSQG